MKLEKKHWTIIGIVVAIIVIWYFFLRKKKTESAYKLNRIRATPPTLTTDYIISSPGNPQTKTCKCNNGNKECGSGYCGICCEGLGGVKL